MTAHWTVVVPFLGLAANSSRLGNEAHTLTRAIGLDTIAALVDAPDVARVMVISDEPDLAGELEQISPKVSVAPVDHAVDAHDAMSSALSALEATHGPVAVVHAVLPALDSAELTELLEAARHVPFGIVHEENGTGTTMMTAQSAAELSARLGTHTSDSHPDATALGSGATIRRSVTSARHLAQVRDWPTLGTRTQAYANARYAKPTKTPSDRRYRIDPPPALN